MHHETTLGTYNCKLHSPKIKTIIYGTLYSSKLLFLVTVAHENTWHYKSTKRHRKEVSTYLPETPFGPDTLFPSHLSSTIQHYVTDKVYGILQCQRKISNIIFSPSFGDNKFLGLFGNKNKLFFCVK